MAERLAALREFFAAQASAMHEVVRTIIGGGARYSAADLFDGLRRIEMLKQRVAPLLASVDVLVIPTVPTMYPSPLGIGHIELEDGSWVQGFVCESWALDGAEEISRFGGWRGWLVHR